MSDVQTPFLEANGASGDYPEESRKRPLPPPPVPLWKTPKGIIGAAILAFAIIGAVVGIVVSTEKKSKKSDAKSDSASGAGGTSSNGTVAALGGAGVAAVYWPSNVRLYTQKDDGFVYEATSDQSGNWNSSTTKLFQAKPETPLAAIAPASSEIHIYYLDTSNMLQEYVYNNGWSNGAAPASPNISPNTSLAATTWYDNFSVQQIRLYYQKQDNTIQELAYSTGSGWSSGQAFSDQAYPGTGLGAFASNSVSFSTRVYWQAKDLTLNEYISGSGWTRNTLQWSASPSSGIAAIAWLNLNIRVYYENIAGNVEEVSYNNASGWAGSPSPPTNTLVGFQSPISATFWVNGADIEIRTYAKSNSSNGHTEFAYSGSWTSKDLTF
ncbi:hypothetical protein BDN72DRAFT_965946 [Pluteus cervinus]|uniref:Uncharacterized protein n=1 Tax=Pluteus cervinus TaxID=181527 RepID=A0ACD3A264_9AGAR|nr:hypothetical protein BDN72DRAFT_965946 [Pluteus cervinus]